MAEQVLDLWFACDRPLDDGRCVIDRLIEEWGDELSRGETRYLRAIRATTMRLYEVEDSLPGESLDLRDVVEGDRIRVRERLGSRSLHRHDWVAARVLAAGTSGAPEIEGILPIPPLLHEAVRDQLRAARARHLEEHPAAPVATFYETVVPLFGDAWASSILDPVVPRLRNTDGEELVLTRVLFDVRDRPALLRALERAEAFERAEEGDDRWRWVGRNARNEPVILGLVSLGEQGLCLEVNSVARGERGRALIEELAGAAVCHRGSTHEDLQGAVKRELTSGGERGAPDARQTLPFEIQEALLLDHHARHYRRWIDEPLPALDGQTPRAAARTAALRPRLVELLHTLDRMYHLALRAGEPAFDPSWMWPELGLAPDAPPHPPPLAHERIGQMVPGSAEICREVAEADRLAPGFDDASTTFTEEEARTSVPLQRLLRDRQADFAGQDLARHLELMVGFFLHRRKCFWVDEALAYMLARTELDVDGEDLRLPFPSFALVFTDRHVLSMAERHLSRQRRSPLAGEYLRIATVYVWEVGGGAGRTLRVCFALDALGADPPVLVDERIALVPGQRLEAFLDGVAPLPQIEPAVADVHPLRGLLHVTINAIRYATSAGVEPQARARPTPRDRRPARGGPPQVFSSEEVFFLPGAIAISQVRRLQDLERIGQGRAILKRFMVRGHWRRAAPSWTDQRPRWIAPHWKGPDLAAIIERTYKLEP